MQRVGKLRGICTKLYQKFFIEWDIELPSKLCIYIIVNFVKAFITLIAIKYERESEK